MISKQASKQVVSLLEWIIRECGKENAKNDKIELQAILLYEQPMAYIVKDTNYDDNYDIPVLTAGQSFILGYTNEKKGIYKASREKPVIIFDDFTASIQWVDFDFKVKSSAMKILKVNDEKNRYIKTKYLFYNMKKINYIPTTHTRQWIETYSHFNIMYPPLYVQEKIVEVLDRFDKLTNDLQEGLPAEMEARKKQYEYYRDKLLTFEK